MSFTNGGPFLLLQVGDIVKAVGNCSYNQLVEKIICCKQSDNSELRKEGGCGPLERVKPCSSEQTFL